MKNIMIMVYFFVSHLLKLKPGATKIEYARNVLKMMGANDLFKDMDPSLVVATQIVNDYESAFNDAAGGGKLFTSRKKAKEAAVDSMLKTLGNYVDKKANGDINIIQAAGMNSQKTSSPAVLPPAPTVFTAVPLTKGGVKVSCNTIKGSHLNLWEGFSVAGSAADVTPTEAQWTVIAQTTKHHFILNNLISGTRYFFRMRAAGVAGNGAYSHVISIIAP